MVAKIKDFMSGKNFEEARQIGKVRLENGNTPARPSLSEAARATGQTCKEWEAEKMNQEG